MLSWGISLVARIAGISMAIALKRDLKFDNFVVCPWLLLRLSLFYYDEERMLS